MYQMQLPPTPIRSQRRTLAFAASRWRSSRVIALTLAVFFAGLATLWVFQPAGEAPPSLNSEGPAATPPVIAAPPVVPAPPGPVESPEPEMPQVAGPAAVEPATVRKAVPTAPPPRAVKKPRAVRRATTAPIEKQPPPKTILATGKLRIKVRPWGEVFVDGTLKGVAPPLAPLELPAGVHTVIVVNQQLKQKLSYQVEVIGGQETELKAVLDEVSSPSP